MYQTALLRGIRNAVKHRGIHHVPTRLFTTSQAPSGPKQNEQHEARSHIVIARLAKAACALREAIVEDAQQKGNSPLLLLDLEQDVDSAFKIISKALDGIQKPCSVEELADRSKDDILVGIGNALSYEEILKAQLLRDDIEHSLVSMQVLPPAESLLDGAGKLSWKPSKKKKKEVTAAAAAEAQKRTVDQIFPGEEQTIAPKELHPVTDEMLEERKKQMESASDVKHLLRGFDTALLDVGRVHKVVKGGTNMSVRALVAIGNRKGTAGLGEGKSENAQHAIERACRDARRNLLSIDMREDRTIYHRVRGYFVKTQVDVWPAPRGTGISASNDFSIILGLFGLKDVGAKLRGTRSSANSVKALFNALSKNSAPDAIAATRGEGFIPLREVRNWPGILPSRVRGGL